MKSKSTFSCHDNDENTLNLNPQTRSFPHASYSQSYTFLCHFFVSPRVTYNADTKVVNTGTFTLNKEDHTLGNILRCQLLRDPRTVFAGYRMPHPLINHTLLRVRFDSFLFSQHFYRNCSLIVFCMIVLHCMIQRLHVVLPLYCIPFVSSFSPGPRSGGLGSDINHRRCCRDVTR